MPIKAVIFDLYGTLMHAPNTRWLPRMLKEMDFSRDDMKRARDISYIRNFRSIAEFAAYFGKNPPKNSSDYENDISMEMKGTRLYPDVLDALEKLKKRDILLGAISNANSPYKTPFFSLGLKNHIKKYIFSCDAGVKKPDKEIYLRMAAMLGVPEKDILMVGNNIFCDVEGPKAAGMDAILLDRENMAVCSRKISCLDGIFAHL